MSVELFLYAPQPGPAEGRMALREIPWVSLTTLAMKAITMGLQGPRMCYRFSEALVLLTGSLGEKSSMIIGLALPLEMSIEGGAGNSDEGY